MKTISRYIQEQLDKFNSDLTLEMANIAGSNTGLDDIHIWVGDSTMKRGNYRIKVSNRPNHAGSMKDSFSIYFPDFSIVGKVNTKHITSTKLEKIIQFMKMNEQAIKDLSDLKIDTVAFIKLMKTV